MTITIGCLVRVNRSPSRTSRVVEVRTNSRGATVYILADGGWFSADELTPVRR